MRVVDDVAFGPAPGHDVLPGPVQHAVGVDDRLGFQARPRSLRRGLAGVLGRAPTWLLDLDGLSERWIVLAVLAVALLDQERRRCAAPLARRQRRAQPPKARAAHAGPRRKTHQISTAHWSRKPDTCYWPGLSLGRSQLAVAMRRVSAARAFEKPGARPRPRRGVPCHAQRRCPKGFRPDSAGSTPPPNAAAVPSLR